MLDQLLQKIVKKLGHEQNHLSVNHRSGSRSSADTPQNSWHPSFGDSDHSPERHSSEPAFSPAKELAPQTLPEFIELIKNTPKSVLSNDDRRRIAAVMSFDERRVGDLMIPKKDIVFVKDSDILGPLVLDKLYQSGFKHFPVVDSQNHVLGVIHTEALNALEIRETSKATKYIDKTVHYLHTSDTLKFAISELERTNNYYFFVLDELDTLAGFFTIEQLLNYLLS